MFTYDRDILIHGPGLWLDARRKKDFAFVSHAHSDHAARHERILATPATLALSAERLQFRRLAKGLKAPRRTPEEMPVDFGEEIDLDGVTVSLHPAGHILGSAQILIRANGSSLLYSGDFCPECTSAAEDISTPKADTLIMECTYGLPEHKFPPRQRVIENLLGFVKNAFDNRRTPVLLCYALGKGQEVVRILGEAGYSVAAEEETFRLAGVYERFGVEFPRMRLLDGPVRPGEAVVTPTIGRVGAYLEGRLLRKAAITGWATGSFTYRAARADVRIPLSDHADFAGLLRYVTDVSPRTVYIVHGPSEFGYYVRKAGFEVRPIHEKAPVVG